VKRKIFTILFALVLVLSFSLMTAVPVIATDHHVNPGDSIQTAIGGAVDGDVRTGRHSRVNLSTNDILLTV